MKSKVYFVKTAEGEGDVCVRKKLSFLLESSKLLDFIGDNSRIALKIHFGEEGNTGFVKPEYAKVISDLISRKNAYCFFCDSNTLYRGRRMNSADHIKLAYEHGFTKERCGADCIIPDETFKDNVADVEINSYLLRSAKVARLFLDADAIIGIAHFKGHMMTGFGGALKNIGMGCASRDGKLAQHSDVSPLVILKKCLGCGECAKSCPVDAIFVKNSKAYIDPSRCIGCATCIASCKQNAMEVNWEAGGDKIQEKMIEYAMATLSSKKGRQAFINFVMKVTKECDCLAKDDPRVVPDIGILVSLDPLSIDKASLDLVNKQAGKDIFREIHPSRDYFKQFRHAAKCGLGNLEYELLEV